MTSQFGTSCSITFLQSSYANKLGHLQVHNLIQPLFCPFLFSTAKFGVEPDINYSVKKQEY